MSASHTSHLRPWPRLCLTSGANHDDDGEDDDQEKVNSIQPNMLICRGPNNFAVNLLFFFFFAEFQSFFASMFHLEDIQIVSVCLAVMKEY